MRNVLSNCKQFPVCFVLQLSFVSHQSVWRKTNKKNDDYLRCASVTHTRTHTHTSDTLWDEFSSILSFAQFMIFVSLVSRRSDLSLARIDRRPTVWCNSRSQMCSDEPWQQQLHHHFDGQWNGVQQKLLESDFIVFLFTSLLFPCRWLTHTNSLESH